MQAFKPNAAQRAKLAEIKLEVCKDVEAPQPDEKKLVTHLFYRYLCLTDLYFLGTDALELGNAKKGRRNIVDPRLHRWMARILEKPEDKMLIIPRRHLKTTWVKCKIVQEVLKNPNIRIALYSTTANLVESELADLKRMFAMPKVLAFFSDRVPVPGKNYKNWHRSNVDQLTIKRDEKAAMQEHQVEAYGVGATVVGKHFDMHFYDDLINQDTVQTQDQMQKTRDWYGYVQGILEPDGMETVTGTPYHYEDFYTWVQKEKIYKHIYRRSAIEAGKPIYSFYSMAMLERLKKRMGDYMFCTPKETPIWMGDGTFKPIEKVEAGDEVVGFTLDPLRLIRTKVKAVSKGRRAVQTIRMESGRMVRCTADHKWYTGRNSNDHHRLYAPVSLSKRNADGVRHLIHVVDPPKVETSTGKQFAYGWLGGMLDGEGACKYQVLAIHQSSQNPEVQERLRQTLYRLDIPFSEHASRPANESWSEGRAFVLTGGRQTKVDLINYCRPAKSHQIMDAVLNNGARLSSMGKGGDRVVSVEPGDRIEDVYGLETETGNYVAWGYASQNSAQFLCDPTPREDMLFPPPQPTYHDLPDGKHTYYITVDPAATTKRYSDYTAIIVAAVSKQGICYVVEALNLKKKGNEVARILIQLAERYRPRRIGVEFGLQEHLRTVIDMTRREVEEKHGRRISLPIEALKVKIERKSKYDKIAWSLGSMVREGRVRVKDSLSELMEQMGNFSPNYSGHDDLVDAASMLFQLIENMPFRHWDKPLFSTVKDWYTIEDLFPKEHALKWADRFVS